MDLKEYVSDNGVMVVLFWDLVWWTEKNNEKSKNGWCSGRALSQACWKYKYRPLLLCQPA